MIVRCTAEKVIFFSEMIKKKMKVVQTLGKIFISGT